MTTTRESFVDALNSAFGKQTTQRAAHAKGVDGSAGPFPRGLRSVDG
jgi:hypothetical protein